MKNSKFISTGFWLAVSALFFVSCKESEVPLQMRTSDSILVNQVGYGMNSQKVALSKVSATSFAVLDEEGKEVFSGDASPMQYWEASGDSVCSLDLTALNTPGSYRIKIADTLVSHTFIIGEEIYKELADAALKSYYYARCGVELPEAYAGVYARKAGHPDTAVTVHASAAGPGRPEGAQFASPGGWYDAGDYGKYVVNSGITTWTLLQSLLVNEGFHQGQDLVIPESNNGIPDILDEALVNLEWMMTMQDPEDGGVYHKLTTKSFDGFIMPDQTDKPRYVVQKSTSAALDFAATMATASRILKKYGVEEKAEAMKDAANKAWVWAKENPEAFYEQPEDISTGAYPDTLYTDEWFWAASEMYLLTEEDQFKEESARYYTPVVTPKWDVVNALGVISLITSDRRDEFAEMEADFLAEVDAMVARQQTNPYRISNAAFAWGSNSDVANDGMLKLVAHKLTGEQRYLEAAREDLHYLLGRNTTGYSFVTGFGDKTPMFPHNRIMSADGVEDPIPGYIVGGPNIIVPTDCASEEVVRSVFPAASYTDTECSYSTNETAINWNAPLVFLASGLNGK